MSELYFQAEEAYKNKDYTKARKLLEKEYLEKKTFRTNYFLFLVFLKIEDYIAAYETANEYIRQYIIDNEKFKKYQKAAIFAGMNVKLQELSIYLNTQQKVNKKNLMRISKCY